MSFVTTEKVLRTQSKGFKVKDYLESKKYIDFKTYLKYRGLIE